MYENYKIKSNIRLDSGTFEPPNDESLEITWPITIRGKSSNIHSSKATILQLPIKCNNSTPNTHIQFQHL